MFINLRSINPVTQVGFIMIIVFLFLGIFAPWIAPYDPYDFSPSRKLQPPSAQHYFGTGVYGEDIFSRVIYGSRFDLGIAAGAVLVSMITGGLLGSIAGYTSGLLDEVIMRIMDILQGFPSFILAMAIAAALGPELQNMIIAISFTNIPVYARLMRAKVLSLRKRSFVKAATAVGNPGHRILLVHIIPNSISPIFVQATLQCGWAILAAAGLSFIGLGLRVPQPEWGVMISMGIQRILTGEWWLSLFPGLSIMMVVMGFNLLGDGLQDLLDPQRRI